MSDQPPIGFSAHENTVGKILSAVFYAVCERPLYSASDHAARIFFTLLDYHGLELIRNGGFVVDDNQVVVIEDDGRIRPPKLSKPYTPELARRLGTALVAAAHHSEIETKGRQ